MVRTKTKAAIKAFIREPEEENQEEEEGPVKDVQYVLLFQLNRGEPTDLAAWSYLHDSEDIEKVPWLLEPGRPMDALDRRTILEMHSPNAGEVFGKFVFYTFARIQKGRVTIYVITLFVLR